MEGESPTLTESFLYSLNVNHIIATQTNKQISSFKTKNDKLQRLIQVKSPRLNFKVPIVNLSLEKLSVKKQKLQMGLEFSFVEKINI